MYIIHITCDKEKVNEMKLHIVMLMNACAHEMQMANAMLKIGVLQHVPLIEISSRDLKDLPFFIKSGIDLM